MKKGISKKNRKIVVALSGGVDSAVAAALLKKQGFEVLGIFLHLGNFTRNPGFQVKKITNKLGIPLKIIDVQEEFRKRIINYFIKSYKNGITPNPCVKCNEEIKFRFLFDVLRREKAEYVATGHYARIHRETPTPKQITKYKLLKAKDETKDQSYFLYRLSQKQLAKIIFPLGGYKKKEVRKIAKKLRLPIPEKEESQDVCFVGCDNMFEFLKENIKIKKGNIVDSQGSIVGTHDGIPLYTLGQRKGIRVGGTGPYFVIGKNKKKNELIVSNNSQDARLWTTKFNIAKVNWINEKLKFPLKAEVKIRYHAPSFSATIKKAKNGKWEVKSKKKIRAVTKGQSAVFFSKGEVYGGGIII